MNNFIKKSIIASAIFSLSCFIIHAAEIKEQKAFVNIPTPLSSLVATQSVSGNFEERILSLMPDLQGHLQYTKSFLELLDSHDPQAIEYIQMVLKMRKSSTGREGAPEEAERVRRNDAIITNCFASFLFKSLDRLLEIHGNIKDKNGDSARTMLGNSLAILQKEIDAASKKTVVDIQNSLTNGWQMTDPNWKITLTKSRSLRTSYHLSKEEKLTPVAQKQVALWGLFHENQFSQLTSEAGQRDFYELCNDNILAAQFFEELLVYQKISVCLLQLIQEMGFKVLTKEQEPNLSSDGNFVINHIVSQSIAQHEPSIDYCIDALIKPLSEIVQTEKAQEKAAREKERKRLKNQKHKANQRAAGALQKKRADKEAVGTDQPPTEEQPAEDDSPLAESPDASQLLATQVAANLGVSDKDGKESEESFDLASALKSQKEGKRVEGAAGAVKESQKFKRSKFSYYILGHDRGTVKTSDFVKFLKDVGGSIEKPTHKGMTYYTLPNFGSNADRYPTIRYHVHLPHGDNEPFYSAIVNHFIRPSFTDAGFIQEMFE